jgi:hypothetical protein
MRRCLFDELGELEMDGEYIGERGAVFGIRLLGISGL